MQPTFFRTVLLSGLLLFSLAISAQRDPADAPDSLHMARTGTSGIVRAGINLEIARFYYMKDIDSLMHYVSLLENHIENDYDVRIDAYIRKFKGHRAFHDLETETAMDYARQAMLLFQELKNFREMGWISINLGTNYHRIGDLAMATEHYLQGLTYFEQVDLKHGIGEAYNNLGRVSYEAGRTDKAKEYFEEALDLFLAIDAFEPSLKIYNNLGLLLMEEGLIRKSLNYLYKSAKGFAQTGDQRKLALVYGNLAVGYDELNRLDSAMIYSRKALALSTQLGDEMGMISGLINLGYFLRLEQKYDSSLMCFQKSLEFSNDHQLPDYEESVYLELSDLYAEMDDYRTAYKYHILQDSLNHLIMNQNAQRRIEELLFSYNQQIKDKELLQLKEEQMMQKRLNLIFLLTIILTFVVVSILIYGYRKNRRQKQMLEEKNDLLAETNLKLENSENELKEMYTEQTKLFSIVAHDLRNPISAVSGFAELIEENYDELDDDTRKEYIEQINQGTFRTLSLLENLLLWARSQMDLVKVSKEVVPVKNLIRSSANHMMSAVEKKNLTLTIDIRDDYTFHVDSDMIKAVIRNLISNAIKFSYPGGEIVISSYVNGDSRCISIKDHGTGITNEVKNTLGGNGTNPTMEGTAKETGSGLGLLISKDYTEKNGGTIEIESEPGKGSLFTICFPA